ncbi:MAG: efflux RND transporter permease subunit, partial [Candidatus Cybelea sp.]
MWLTRASLRNPITVTLLCFLVLVSGAAAFLAMGRSILPPVSFPIVTVTAPYAGAGTEEMERLVVRPIEDELEGVPQLERVSSYAQAGVANIVVRFRFGSSIETDRSNVQQAVESARANMPPDLVPPVVATEDPSQIPVLTESLTSAVLSPRELSEIVDRTIAPALRAAPAIGSVVVSGDRTRQFTVVPDLGALDALGLSVLDINRSLAGANDVLPGGVLRSSTAEANVGVRSASENAEDLRRLPVAMELANVRLGDLARVVDGRAQETIVSRVDGAPAVVVFVSRAENADALGAIAGAQRLFTNLARRYPLIRFETLRTEAPYTTAAIGGVLQSLGEGVVLTVLVMVLFLHAWRNALISAIAIPVSLCAAFVAMWIAGFTIDVLSLMGLSLTIGILVDDSIVIIEAIVRSAARGLKDDDAALAGRSELGGAAFAITLVDVAVFAPIAFMGGVIGEFMREFGLTIVFATAFSLVVAYTLTPLLAARWALPRSAVPFAGWQTLPWMLRGRTVRAAIEAWHRGLARFSQMEERVAESYAMRWLPEAAKRRRLVLCGALIVSSVAFIPAFDGGIATEFSPPVDRGEAVIDLQYPPGTPLGRSDRETNALAGTLLEDPAIAHVAAVSGRGFNGSTDVVASNLAQLVVVLADPLASGDATIERVKALAGVVPDARIAGSGRGMGGSAPITYTIAGEAGAADEAASRLAETLESDRNATDVRISNAGISPRVEIDVDPSKAMTLGVAADDAAQTARIATGGAIAAKVRLRTGLANVVLQSDAAEHGDLDDALRVEVRDRSGRLV